MTYEWTEHSPTAWEYVSDDLCACVWVEGTDVVWWDVSGPKGRGTIASGSVPSTIAVENTVLDRMRVATRLAGAYIAGFRRGRDQRA